MSVQTTKARHPIRTIALTLLGQTQPPSAACAHRVRTDEVHGRKALLVVRCGESATALRRRVMDSIARLAGGPVLGSGDLADRILERQRREGAADADAPHWMLAHVQGDTPDDPYAPRSPRLTLLNPSAEPPKPRQRETGRWLPARSFKKRTSHQPAASLR